MRRAVRATHCLEWCKIQPMHAFLIIGKDKDTRRKNAEQRARDLGTKEIISLVTESKHTVEEIRNLKSSLSYAARNPEEGRAVIIEEAQLFTLEAANAFLKTLE